MGQGAGHADAERVGNGMDILRLRGANLSRTQPRPEQNPPHAKTRRPLQVGLLEIRETRPARARYAHGKRKHRYRRALCRNPPHGLRN